MSKLKIKLLTLTFSIGVAFGSGLGFGFQKAFTTPANQLGLAEYHRLQAGMSKTEVEAILGRGIEIESSESNSTYIWEHSDTSNIKVVFKLNKLVRKSQEKLK